MKKLFFTAILIGAFSFGYSQSSQYDNYRRSVTSVNWQNVASDLLLTAKQKQELNDLNNRYSDYNSWKSVYGDNPDRWRTDRYSEMERIFGSTKYTKFKNKYYKGQNPVAVYNRNKNNDMRYKHLNKKAANHKSHKSKEYGWKAQKAVHGNKGKGKNK